MKKLKITLEGKSYEVEVEILEDDFTSTVPCFPMSPNVPIATPSPVLTPSAPKATSSNSGGNNTLTAPMNGVVIEIPVKVGDLVKTNQVVIILEAMKMKTNISSPFDGKIASINVSPNDSVETGQVLITYS